MGLSKWFMAKNVIMTNEEILKQAQEIQEQIKKENAQAFESELQELMKKYNVQLVPQIIIQPI